MRYEAGFFVRKYHPSFDAFPKGFLGEHVKDARPRETAIRGPEDRDKRGASSLS